MQELLLPCPRAPVLARYQVQSKGSMVSFMMCLREGQPPYRRAKVGEKGIILPKQDMRECATYSVFGLYVISVSSGNVYY